MILKFLFVALLPALTWAQSKQFCSLPQIAKEAQIFIKYKAETGIQAIGPCLNEAINESFLQKASRGQKIEVNLATIERIVVEILDAEKKAIEVAKVRAEIFESGRDADGDIVYDSEIQEEADLRRQSPLFGEFGEYKD